MLTQTATPAALTPVSPSSPATPGRAVTSRHASSARRTTGRACSPCARPISRGLPAHSITAIPAILWC
ncbi:hypothetical protein [Nonomuraea wenchangensis]|uniref:hypothetical protein n=1 Tax=Nonomuraea wenchangensis TaxID=568860 RepID=UPI003416BE49